MTSERSRDQSLPLLPDEIEQLRQALREREEQLRLTLERAAAADRRKEELLALLGHELRNPLAPITTALELMKLSGDRSHAREREVIERQVGHLTRLVDDLLDISRLTRGKLELKREHFALQDVLGRALEMASPLLEKHSHTLTMEVPPSPLILEGDEIRLAQVFHNLLTNAAKYTPPNGRIRIAGELVEDGVRIRISDNGVGIPADMLNQIWEPFVQANQALHRAEGGLGIGLSLVQRLVQLHGGHVSVKSEGPSKGSVFEVWLPRSQGTSKATRKRPAGPRLAVHGKGRRVLIVDDNLDAADTLAEFLQSVGYEVSVAHDGPSGLSLGVRVVPDVAILDIGLPVMDGYELARRLRETLGPRTGRIIALTGYGQEQDRAASLGAGFSHHVVKPVDLDVLLRLIDSPN